MFLQAPRRRMQELWGCFQCHIFSVIWMRFYQRHHSLLGRDIGSAEPVHPWQHSLDYFAHLSHKFPPGMAWETILSWVMQSLAVSPHSKKVWSSNLLFQCARWFSLLALQFYSHSPKTFGESTNVNWPQAPVRVVVCVCVWLHPG